ncbi:MAG: cytochrome c peroxidase [Phycisphaerales bacterium]|jgi:cytochrome c peroxidase
MPNSKIRTNKASRLSGLAIALLVGGVPLAAGTTLITAALLLVPADLPPINVPTENPITEAKRVLGKALFWDEQLSSDNTRSCGSCHFPEHGGSANQTAINPGKDHVFGTPDDAVGSPGVRASTNLGDFQPNSDFGFDVQATGRYAPSAIMGAFNQLNFWDGRAGDTFVDPQTGEVSILTGGSLESQAVGPPTSSAEMAHAGRDWTQISAKLETSRPLAMATNLPADLIDALGPGVDYPALFSAAFGDPAINADRIAKAIATYERTLISDQAPWDRYVAGDQTALTPTQIEGLNAFAAGGCDICHVEGTFGSDVFANIGVRPSSEDAGRQNVTGSPGDAGRFKTPSLRNVGLRSHFMHNGRFTSLLDVMRFYMQNNGAPQRFEDNLDPVIPNLSVPGYQFNAVVDFMANGLTDPRVANAQFPFDRPTLFSERQAEYTQPVDATGVLGAGFFEPQIIADSPPMIGTDEFRVGLHDARGGASAMLVASHMAPTGALVLPDAMWGPVSLSGSNAGEGYTTAHVQLDRTMFDEGEVLFFQWQVADADAPGGIAASPAVRITFFCPRGGCAPACDPDVNKDGNADSDDVSYLINVVAGGDNPSEIDPDFNKDGNVDFNDVDSLVNTVAGGPCP